MKIGAAFVLGFIGMNKINDFLQFAYKKELKVIELVAEPPICYIDDININQKNEIVKLAEDLGIEITIHATFSDVNIAALNPDVRNVNIDIVKKSIQFASDLSSKIVTIHPGSPGAGGMSHPEDVKLNNLNSVIELTNFAEKRKIKIGYENLPKMPWHLFEESYSPFSIHEFIAQINNPYLGITWDLGHSNTTNYSLADFFNNFKDYIFHLHIHDNNGPVNEWSDIHAPLGSGTIDWERLMVLLKQIKYQKTCVLELNTIQKIEQSLDFLSSFF